MFDHVLEKVIIWGARVVQSAGHLPLAWVMNPGS